MMQDNMQPVQDMDVAISSRVRLARNLEAYPFSTRMTRAHGAEILEKVKKAIFSDSGPDFSSGFTYYDMNAMKPLDRQLLVEKHLISPEFAEGQNERAAIISRDERVSILVNEEDHLRLQCIYPGMQLAKAWKRCDELDTRLDAKLGFAFDNVSGYLTCCPTNAGTGIRASVMLHLPALSMTGYIKNVLETCSKIGVAVRGAYGENSEASGNMFQISNQVTLGQTEEEIITGISNITSQISNQERMLRNELYRQNPQRFEDRIFRSLGLLQNARIMSSEESQKLLSDVRLGVIMGLIRHVDLKKIDNMMLMIQQAYLQKLAGVELRPDERDVRRAELLRKNLDPGGML